MDYTIENEKLVCTIASNGAEIRSLKNKATGQEYIWQINPDVWGSSSPVLFPAIGKIKSDKIVYDGKDYAMPKHGIIRNNDSLLFVQNSESACSFTLESSETTFKQYPFKFRFSVVFSLNANRLTMEYRIENKDDVPMYFCCGGHTAYAIPLDEKTKLSDYVIEFPEKLDLKAQMLGKSGLLSNKKRNIQTIDNTLSLSETLFNEDALIFPNIAYDWVRLRKKEADKGILVRFKGYPNLALWSKPGVDYVCIEPWLGLPDHEEESINFTEKATYQSIAPNEIFKIAIETEIEG
uniref:aldose 1-epimerase family protein n=1 Tax=Flavobacterium sp. TaxID=239 RepID=UPI00404AACBB